MGPSMAVCPLPMFLCLGPQIPDPAQYPHKVSISLDFHSLLAQMHLRHGMQPQWHADPNVSSEQPKSPLAYAQKLSKGEVTSPVSPSFSWVCFVPAQLIPNAGGHSIAWQNLLSLFWETILTMQALPGILARCYHLSQTSSTSADGLNTPFQLRRHQIPVKIAFA